MTTIFKQFTFDAAHFLPKVPEDHKCRRLHGHTYQLTVYVSGHLSLPQQWIMDFGDLKAVVQKVIRELDHTLLNDVSGLENPTAEILAAWIWERLIRALPQLSKIELKETPTSGVIVEPSN